MNKFICPYPWRGASLTTDGHFRVCAVAQSSKSKGIIKNSLDQSLSVEEVQQISDLLNTSTLKSLRSKMLSGEDVSENCVRCMSEEGLGIESARQRALKFCPDFDLDHVLKITNADGTLDIDSQIENIILRLGNKCNLACRMCGPSSSNQWYKEWKETRFAGFQDTSGRIALIANSGKLEASPNPYRWVENGDAFRFLKMCGANIRNINFSGGEPLINKEHQQILQYLVDEGYAANISIDYNTNLTVLNDEILDLWTKFKRLMVGVSVDGSPSVNEYIRKGTQSSHLEKNLKKLNDSSVSGIFWISTTVQIYNSFDLLNLKNWFSSLNLSRFQKDIAWHILRSPAEMSIYSLPQDLKVEFSNYIKNRSEFSPLAEAVFHQDQEDQFKNFISATQRMDEYRNESVKTVSSLWDKISKFYEA